MIGIVASRADRASTHVAERLRELADWTEREDAALPDADGGGTFHTLDAGADSDVYADSDATTDAGAADRFELRSFDGLHIELDDPTDAFSARPDCLVFVSRHSGDTGPLLTCHFTGNFGAAEYGGSDRSFAPACPGVQRALVAGFDEHAPEGYGVAIEGTHHGPTELAVPGVFAELGSGDEQWDDPAGARAVARAVLDLPDRGASVAVGDPGRPRHVAGFGGGHYAPRFERVIRETPWGVGHVAADWQLDELGHPGEHADTLRDALDASDADLALVEGERPALRRALADLGCRVVSETWVRAVGAVPLALVAALEDELSTVEEGLRFGAHAGPGALDGEESTPAERGGGAAEDGEPPDGYRVADLPADLLAAAQGVDAERARAAVESRAVAFETEQSGTRPVGRAALPVDGDAYGALVDDLAAVLRERYDEVAVRRDEGVVVARVEEFDPSLAATLGVPEGPKFGALSAGEPVEVDGDTVPPGAVRSEREETFEI